MQHPVRRTRATRRSSAGSGDRQVVFLPRHGADHRFPPHRVNYRANLWALRSARGAPRPGARQRWAPCAPTSRRGTLVVPDQVIDATWGRASTFYDEVGAVVHVGLADPYCPQGRRAVGRPARPRHAGGRRRHDGRDPGPALLHPCRVPPQRRGRGRRRRDDRDARGGTRPRAGPVLHQPRRGDRRRRRGRGVRRGVAPGASWRSSRGASTGCDACSPSSSTPCRWTTSAPAGTRSTA